MVRRGPTGRGWGRWHTHPHSAVGASEDEDDPRKGKQGPGQDGQHLPDGRGFLVDNIHLRQTNGQWSVWSSRWIHSRQVGATPVKRHKKGGPLIARVQTNSSHLRGHEMHSWATRPIPPNRQTHAPMGLQIPTIGNPPPPPPPSSGGGGGEKS